MGKVVSEANKALVDNFVVQNTNDNSEWEIIKSKKRHVECASLPVPVKAHYERSVTFDDSIKEDVKEVQEYLKGNIKAAQTDQEEDPCSENTENNLKNRNTKIIKDPILELNADVGIEVEISNAEKNSIQKVCPTEIKKSYSSAITNNLAKTWNRNDTISSPTKFETVPNNLCCPTIQTRTEQEFDNVPLSVSKPDKRENISKRKHKNIKFEDSPLPGDLKLVAPVEKSFPIVVIKVDEVPKAAAVVEENTSNDAIDKEIKKLRRRKSPLKREQWSKLLVKILVFKPKRI